MINLGILTLCPERPSDYFEELGKLSKEAEVKLFLFSPLAIMPGSDAVSGFCFDHDQQTWANASFEIPEMLYDRCLYGENKNDKDAQAIVSWLKTRKDITFLGYGLPNKWSLYEKLKTDLELSPYLPQTKKVSSAQQIIQEAQVYGEVIIKPVNGAHGYAVYSIQFHEGMLLIKTTKNGKVVSKLLAKPDESIPFFERLLIKNIYIVQPRLPNLDETNRPFDLRVFLQKNGEGKWIERARGIRIGQSEGILTNMSAGASILPYSEWKTTTPQFNHSFLEKEIKELLEKLPPLLEEHFFPLFELGIDIIIAKDESIWVLDINSKPGRKLVASTNPVQLESLYKAPFDYCRFLTEKVDERFEKTK
ncbi:YheC/YheD family protein [Falsibacillus pallidus]|uniref:YheC/D-like protein n=1 Tax=Falsibacillus pallidus TaxID=493781 RepID=A0A370GWL1_9BACI|nr:YheC/YheD family protein [Falsibacillus pallidus]RDI47889.1 YheC/D-like protein [Falsibacillus pallidus]